MYMSRRELLGRMSAAAIATLIAMRVPVAAARESGRILIPEGEMRLVRRVTRCLGDGHSIIVEREWIVDFSSRGIGWAVDGRQQSVDVEAPERLAPIAELERRRVCTELFPLELDGGGMISENSERISPLDLDKVAAAAKGVLDEQGASSDEVKHFHRFMAQLQQSASSLISSLPADLFFPVAKPFAETRTIAMPGGQTGEIELSYKAIAHPGSGLLDSSHREVVTRVGGTEMRSSESWHMRPV